MKLNFLIILLLCKSSLVYGASLPTEFKRNFSFKDRQVHILGENLEPESITIALHNMYSDARLFSRGFLKPLETKMASIEAKSMILAPEGSEAQVLLDIFQDLNLKKLRKTWNAGPYFDLASKEDDLGYVVDLVNAFKNDTRYIGLPISILGFSAGGFLAYRLICEHKNIVDQLIVIGGGISKQHCKIAHKPIPILHIHSRVDEVIPFKGKSFRYPESEESLNLTPIVDTIDLFQKVFIKKNRESSVNSLNLPVHNVRLHILDDRKHLDPWESQILNHIACQIKGISSAKTK